MGINRARIRSVKSCGTQWLSKLYSCVDRGVTVLSSVQLQKVLPRLDRSSVKPSKSYVAHAYLGMGQTKGCGNWHEPHRWTFQNLSPNWTESPLLEDNTVTCSELQEA